MDRLPESGSKLSNNAIKLDVKVGKWIRLKLNAHSDDLPAIKSLVMWLLLTLLLLLAFIAFLTGLPF